jgi:hypothetical protein
VAGPPYFGTLEGEVIAAQAADGTLQVIDIDPSLLTLAGATDLSDPDCAVAPADPDCLDLRVQIPPSLPVSLSSTPSKTDPTTAVSTWTVTNTSGKDLQKALLVFVSSPGAVNNNPTLVGLEPVTADGYTVVHFDDAGFGEIFYAAVQLGPLGSGATTTAMVHYVVADDLIPAGPEDYFLPKLNTQAIVVAVPEPGTLLLLAFSLVGLAFGPAVVGRSWCD